MDKERTLGLSPCVLLVPSIQLFVVSHAIFVDVGSSVQYIFANVGNGVKRCALSSSFFFVNYKLTKKEYHLHSLLYQNALLQIQFLFQMSLLFLHPQEYCNKNQCAYMSPCQNTLMIVLYHI